MQARMQACTLHSTRCSNAHLRFNTATSHRFNAHQVMRHRQLSRPRLVVAAAASAPADEGGGSSSSRNPATDADVSDIMRKLSRIYRDSEIPDVESVVQELAAEGMLRQPPPIVPDFAKGSKGLGSDEIDIDEIELQFFFCKILQDFAHGKVTLQSQPKKFRQLLEAALVKSVLLTQPEIEAKGRVIDGVVQALQHGSSNGALQLSGLPVSIDRVHVGGSVGKSVAVQGDFDIDLVVFVNLPAAAGISIDLMNPDAALEDGSWLKQLQEQVAQMLEQELARVGLQLAVKPFLGQTAVMFTVRGLVPESGEQYELEVDVVLVPNLATGAGAEAAAKWGAVIREGEAVADFHTRAMLAPIVQKAEAAGREGEWFRLPRSNLRSTWHAEGATAATAPGSTGLAGWQQHAPAAVAAEYGLSGRVVTSTVRLLKAWVRQGLQPHQPAFKAVKSYSLELVVMRAINSIIDRPSHMMGPGCDSIQQALAGRYVLDLLTEALREIVETADKASTNAFLQFTTAWSSDEGPPAWQEVQSAMNWLPDTIQDDMRFWDGRPAMVIVGPDMLNCPFRLRPGIAAMFGAEEPDYDSGIERLQMSLLHPVDPLNLMTAEERQAMVPLWQQLREEAEVLLRQLQEGTWLDILNKSSLGPVFKN